MSDRSVRVTLSAQVQGYIDGMQKAAQATRETGTEAEKLSQQSQAFELMGRAAMIAGGTVLAGLGTATKAAIDWETAWAGVTKTVDGSPEQMAALEQSLRGLSGVLPASHAEIAAVAEAAGQLGIETPNVAAFTKTMIDLGETTNLSSEQAATSLARFTNIMGTSQAQVSNLGSALVDLGNNYATTEAEIMEMAMRLAGAGAQIGMSEGQVLGLSTALSSVGIEAEAGGSAMSKVMIDIESSVQRGGDRLQKFADVAGMSAQAFSEKWRKDPGEALAAFVSGLKSAEDQGKSAIGVLDELGITEIRMRDALLRSSQAADLFSGAMKKGNEAFEENAALTAEAEKRYETTAAKIGTMRNKVVDAAIAIGQELLPLVEGGAETVGKMADAFSGLEGPMSAMVAWGGLIVGTGLLGAGLWMAAIPKIAEYRNAMETLNLAGGRLERTLGIVGRAAGFVAGIGLIVALSREAEADVTALANAFERGASASDLMGEAVAAQANKAGGFKNLMPELKAGIDDVSAALDYAATKSDQGFFWTRRVNDGELRGTLDTLKLLGDELAKVGAEDVPKMQGALSDLSDSYGWSAREQEAFIRNSPNLKKALEESAGGLGLTTKMADLLKVAFGGVGEAAESGSEGTDKQKNSLEGLAGVAQETSDEVADLADEIRNFGSASFDVEEAAIRLQSEYQRLADVFDGGKQSLDLTTEAGRDTVQSLLDVASAANESAGATAAMGGSQEEVNAILGEARERIIEARMALGEDRETAEAWADSKVASADAVKESLDRVTGAANGIPPNSNANVSTDAPGAVRLLNQVTTSANQIPKSKTVTVEAVVDRAISNIGGVLGALAQIPSVKNIVVNQLKGTVEGNANGGIYAYANGGIAAYASGGFATGIYKGGAPIHKFAEPETGWEAYISGKPSERDRNRQIWQDTGRRLGMDGGREVVHVPTHVTVVDADRVFAGTMRVIASKEIDGFVADQARAGRRAGF